MRPVDLAKLFARRDEPSTGMLSRDHLAPILVEARKPSSIPQGEAALRAGKVAVLLVAGGQGSRLGFDKPKGMYRVGPVSGATLFEIHVQKVLALRTRYQSDIPFLVMTSPATHDDTIGFFEANRYFGLPESGVRFFQQDTMPALDLTTGEPLLEAPGKVFLSPNGHGGTLTALADSGLLSEMESRGIEHFFYFQVDNPLVKVADPAFVGRHLETQSEASSKVVFKERPEEKVGILALIDGRCSIIEYSDLPRDLAMARAADGTLLYRAGNPAIHLFSLKFLRKVTSGAGRLQYHVAKKKVPYYDPVTKSVITPSTENALKFELFIFDALPLADRWLVTAVNREDEFAPLKNASGVDSPETVRALMISEATRWLEAAGVTVKAPVEVSPLFALDESTLKAKIGARAPIVSPTYFNHPDSP